MKGDIFLGSKGQAQGEAQSVTTVAALCGRGLWLMQERVNSLGGPEPWPVKAAGVSTPT